MKKQELKHSMCEEFMKRRINSSHIEAFRHESCSEITVISLQDYVLKASTCEEFLQCFINSSHVECFLQPFRHGTSRRINTATSMEYEPKSRF